MVRVAVCVCVCTFVYRVHAVDQSQTKERVSVDTNHVVTVCFVDVTNMQTTRRANVFHF